MLRKLPYLISLVLVVLWLTGCATSEGPGPNWTTAKIDLTIKPVLDSLPEKPTWEIHKVDMSTASDEEVVKAYLITVEQCTSYATELEMLLMTTTRQR